MASYSTSKLLLTIMDRVLQYVEMMIPNLSTRLGNHPFTAFRKKRMTMMAFRTKTFFILNVFVVVIVAVFVIFDVVVIVAADVFILHISTVLS